MKSQSFTATIKKGSKELYLSSGQDTIAKNGAFVKIGKNEICYQIESYTSLELKMKFDIIEIPMKSIKDSIWGEMTKDERLGQSVQGFRQSIDANGNTNRIPHIGFSADLDYLDEFVNRLTKKIKNIKEE